MSNSEQSTKNYAIIRLEGNPGDDFFAYRDNSEVQQALKMQGLGLICILGGVSYVQETTAASILTANSNTRQFIQTQKDRLVYVGPSVTYGAAGKNTSTEVPTMTVYLSKPHVVNLGLWLRADGSAEPVEGIEPFDTTAWNANRVMQVPKDVIATSHDTTRQHPVID